MARGENTVLEKLVTSREAGGYTLPAELVDAFNVFENVKRLVIETPPTLDSESAAAQIVAKITAGESADLVSMAAEVAEIELGKKRYEEAGHILRLAIEQSGDLATNLGSDLTEKIIIEHLRPALEKVHAEASEVAKALVGSDIKSPFSMATASQKARTAYSQLPELVARRQLIYTARRWANTLGHRVVQFDADGLFGEFENPLAFNPGWHPPMKIQIPAPSDPMDRLLWVASDAGSIGKPWLPTQSEQDEAWLAQFGPNKPRQSFASING